MESGPKKSILNLEPNAQYEIRKQFDLHKPGAMADLIDNFQQWIMQQNHFIKKDFDKQYLENTLISAKGSLERAKQTLDKICTAKTLKPDFFGECDANALKNKFDFVIPSMLPKHTPDYYRVYLLKVVSSNFKSVDIMDYYKFALLIIEYVRRYDHYLGIHCVIDGRDQNILKVLMNIDLMELKYFVTLLLEGHGIRVKGIHLLSESKSINAAVAFTKQVVSAKLANRIYVHNTLEDFYNHIPKDILPADYGGLEKPLQSIFYDWVNLLATEENVAYLKDICRPGTDETLRPAASYNENVLGMPGSFRNLRVD